MKRILTLVVLATLLCSTTALAADGWLAFGAGSRFLGGNNQGAPNGLVILIDEAKDMLYIGECLNGVKQGTGLLYTLVQDGASLYCGGFESNLRSGHGVYYSADGTRFEGTFSEGMLDGVCNYQKDGVVYEARFENNTMAEILSQSDATDHKTALLVTAANGGRMLGEFSDGVLNGWGAFVNTAGDVYIGMFAGNTYQPGSGPSGTLVAANPNPPQDPVVDPQTVRPNTPDLRTPDDAASLQSSIAELVKLRDKAQEQLDHALEHPEYYTAALYPGMIQGWRDTIQDIESNIQTLQDRLAALN